MRPCDVTSGLARRNRRKAVFAFKGLFLSGIRSGFRFRTLNVATFSGSAGKIGNRRAQPVFFGNKTAGRGSVKPRSGRPISVLPSLSDGRIMRQCA